MKQLFGTIIMSLAITASAAGKPSGLIADWKFSDGRGSDTLTDFSQNKLNGKVQNLQKGCRWAWDDFEGSFMQFDGDKNAHVFVPASPQLNLNKQFSIQIKFSCDFSKIGRVGFASLLCKGKEYKSQYSIMVSKKGQILVYMKGLSRPYNLFNTSLSSNKEYTLTACWNGSKLELYVNGKKNGILERTGSLTPTNEGLYIGGTTGYPFAGIIKFIKITNDLLYGTKSSISANASENKHKKTQISKHSIYFKDFHKMTPREAVVDNPYLNKWFVEKKRLYKSPGTLDLPDLSYDPQLKGKYNLYVGILRRVNIPNGIQVKTSDMEKYATIHLSKAPRNKPNNSEDIMWAANVEMNGQKINLHSISDRFIIIQYLRFVPAEKDINKQIDERVKLSARNTDDQIVKQRIKDRYFIQRHYVTPKPSKLKISAKSQARGFILFTPDWMELVFPKSQPEKDTGDISLKKSGARGETVCTTFAVRPLKNIPDLTVNIGDFKSGSEAIQPENIKISEVRLLNKRFGAYRGPGEFMHAPMYLEPARTTSLEKDCTIQYWINVNIPANTKSGKYTGLVTLKSQGVSIAEIPMELDVYPFSLEPLREISQGFYARLLEGNKAAPEPLKTMKSIGLNSISPFVNVDSGIKINGTYDNPEVIFDDSIYERSFKAFAEAKMTGEFFVHLSKFDAVHKFCTKYLPDEKKYAKAYSSIVKQIHERAGKYGIKKVVFTPYDEILSQKAVDLAYRDLKLLKRMGLKTAVNHLWEKTCKTEFQAMVDKIFPLADIIILRYSGKPIWYVDKWEDIIVKAKKYGKKLFHYNFTNGLAFPEMESMRFAAGWFYRSLGDGCSGSLLWNYDLSRLNCRDDLDAHHTDWIYVYPPEGKDKGGPALLLEAMREGITDLRYITTLEDLIEKNKNNPAKKSAVNRAKLLIKSLAGSIDTKMIKEKCSFLESSWEKAWNDEDGERFAAGRLCLPNGWQFEDYDKARAKLAQMIIALSK